MRKVCLLRKAQVVALAASTTLFGQAPADSNDQVVTLPSFSVSANQPNEYRAVDSSSASRIRSQILDTPASISVLTAEFLQDVGPARIYDATRYLAGISEGRGDGFADRQIIRGFENLNRTVDNFASIQGENADPLLIDRVEVLKGPSAIIAPTGAPGGVVSLVSKAPLYQNRRTLSVMIGRIAAQRVDLDISGPLSDDSPFAYRLLAGYQDGELAADDTYDERKVIGGSVTYRVSPQTQITLRGSFEDRAVFVYLPVFISSASVNGADAILAEGFKYGDDRNGTETWAHRGGEYGTVDLLATSFIGDHLSSRFAAKYQYNLQRDMFMAAVTPGLNNRYNPETGQQTPDQTWARNPVTGTYEPTNSPLFDITNIQRRPFLPEGHAESIAAQYDLAANFKSDAVSSTTVAGVAYDDQESFARQMIGPSLPFNLLMPVYGAQPVFDTLASKQTTESTTWQFYINEQLGFFNDRLLLTGGFVYVMAESDSLNQVSNIRTVLDDSNDIFLYGGLFKITDTISIYASHSSNAVPTIANNQPLWQEGQQNEFGFKASLLDKRLSITAAHFQIAQTNVTVPNPAFQSDPTQPQSLISDLKNRGYEIEIMGGLTDQLSVVASATWLDETDSLGRPVRAIADRNFALFLNYDFELGAQGTLSLFHGDHKVGEGTIRTQPGMFSLAGEGLSVGRDSGEAVTVDYPGEAPWPFTGGTVHRVAVDVSGTPYVDLEREAAAMLSRE